MEEHPAELEPPGQTVTIALDHRALIGGVAILATVGALALGILAGRLLSAPEATAQPAAAQLQPRTQMLPQVQAPGASSRVIQIQPQSGAGLTVDLDTPDSPSAGKPAPDFTLENLAGDMVSLSDLKGKPVLINFWATWCPPCRFEMPAIEAAYQKYKGQGFVVLAVDVQEPRGLVAPYVEKLGLTFPVVLDVDGQVAIQYRIRAYPTSYFVNRAGEITWVHRGMMTGQMIERYLADILPEG